MTIHEDDVRKGLSSDECYGKYFLAPLPEIDELPGPEQEYIDDAVHYLGLLAQEIGFEGMYRLATFETIMAGRIRILEMMAADIDPMGIFSRMLEVARINLELAREDPILQSFIIDTTFRLTPEAMEWFSKGVLSIGELFKSSPGSLLPS